MAITEIGNEDWGDGVEPTEEEKKMLLEFGEVLNMFDEDAFKRIFLWPMKEAEEAE